jgi:NitT/TauT family transport system ATP-binding protein
MLFEVKHLSKTYNTRSGDKVLALSDLSFSIAEKEFVSVIGPSGCGKSTLLKILSGLLSRDGGEVSLLGEAVSGPRADIGLVFQDAILLPWRTIIQNIMLPIEIRGFNRETYRKRAIDLLNLVGLGGFEHKYPNELSGGMQQRAAICRALVADPAILLMDEPFGALDAMTREYMNVELLRIWAAASKTILFVTHSIPEAVFLSDRVIVLTGRPGTICEEMVVDLPRPRALTDMNTDRFGTFVKQLRRHFSDSEGGLD